MEPLLQVTELLRRLPSPAQLQLRRGAVYLADDVPEDETILFEAALDDLTVRVQRDAAEELHLMSMQVCSRINQRQLVNLVAIVFHHVGHGPLYGSKTVCKHVL